MIDLYRDFNNECKQKFQFLIDEFGFEIVDNKQSAFSNYIVYQNSITAVKISFEPRENRIFVLLMRLVDGKLPEYPTFIKSDTTINSFYLDDLIDIKNPSTTVEQKDFGNWLTSSDIKDILEKYAHALRLYGNDILQGNFDIFPELEKKVKERAKRLNEE